MSDYECPKCKCEYDATGSREDDAGEHECDECGFRFIVEIEYDPSYDTRCVEHDFSKPLENHPGYMACVYCWAVKEQA